MQPVSLTSGVHTMQLFRACETSRLVMPIGSSKLSGSLVIAILRNIYECQLDSNEIRVLAKS